MQYRVLSDQDLERVTGGFSSTSSASSFSSSPSPSSSSTTPSYGSTPTTISQQSLSLVGPKSFLKGKLIGLPTL